MKIHTDILMLLSTQARSTGPYNRGSESPTATISRLADSFQARSRFSNMWRTAKCVLACMTRSNSCLLNNTEVRIDH